MSTWFTYRAISSHGDGDDDDVREGLVKEPSGTKQSPPAAMTRKASFGGLWGSKTSKTPNLSPRPATGEGTSTSGRDNHALSSSQSTPAQGFGAAVSSTEGDLISLDYDDRALSVQQAGGMQAAAPSTSHCKPRGAVAGSGTTATIATGYSDFDELFGDLRVHSEVPDKCSSGHPGLRSSKSESATTQMDDVKEPSQRDFEVEDSSEHERRELLIYALPLYRDETIFLPVATWRDEPDEPWQGAAGAAQKKMGAVKDKVVGKWDALKDKEPGTLGNKIWRAGQRIAENVSPTERLMRAIPKDVTRVKVFHSTLLSPDVLSDRLVKMAADARLSSGAKATVAGLFLPVALTLDLLVIPGVHVLTAYTAWQLGKNTSSTLGAQRMAKYVAQEGRGEKGVRVDYVPDPRLDKYSEVVQYSVDGVLAEEEIAGLAADLQQDVLVEPMLELRARHVRLNTTKQDDYALLPSN